ncbi:HTH-type transcriptional regulator CymR [bacterium HR21]|jgi:Rrf2 family protein|nr:HTH-type transcriptional regulator CymR [bacterium HR21]
MLRLSRRVEYALLALQYLARHHGKAVSVREIAQAYGLSGEFLAKVLQQLARSGIVGSHHGVYGGYFLMHHPRALTLGAIIDAVEAPWTGLVECRTGEERCALFLHCTIRHPLTVLEQRFRSILDSTTLAELVEHPAVQPLP